MKIVAVTACPTGIAHTYMAAARLEMFRIPFSLMAYVGLEPKYCHNLYI